MQEDNHGGRNRPNENPVGSEMRYGMSRSLRIGVWVTAAAVVASIGVVAFRDTPLDVAVTEVPSTYDPVEAGEELPRGFRQIVPRDQIEPVYEPIFTNGGSVDWPDDSLVIGVEGVKETKAYPVTHLNSREMVLDDIEGIPILVSW